MKVADIRREYNLASLRRRDLDPDPLAQFRKWFDQTAGTRRSGTLRRTLIRIYKTLLLGSGGELVDVNAATLATVGADGNPSARIVLLKGVDERGFVFFTNYESRKGRELAGNPNAALVFYWADQERQVNIAGEVTKVSREESAAYFRSRPKASQLAAWASHQSEVLADRAEIEKRWQETQAKFPGDDVPMPTYWGGYVLKPARIEFWQGRPGRLHDRFRYTRETADRWKIERLSP